MKTLIATISVSFISLAAFLSSPGDEAKVPSPNAIAKAVQVAELSPESSSVELISRVDAASAHTHPESRKLVSVNSLKLVGGWRLPPAFQQPGWKSLAYTNGGLAVRLYENQLQIFVTHHDHLGGKIQELFAAFPQGSPNSVVTDWPIADSGRFLGDLYRPVKSAYTKAAKPTPTGLFWDHESARLLVSGRAGYAVPPPNGTFMTMVELENDKPLRIDGPFGLFESSPQVFGGGFCDIPEWFQKTYLKGETLGIGFGGYCSGQGSTHGPSLTACHRELIEQSKHTVLLRFGGLGTKNAATRENRPNDYSNATNVWSIETDDKTGYWAADRVTAGPVWIDTPTHHGLAYWSLQGCGRLDYKRQTETFGETTKIRMYVYDPRDLGKVAKGKLKPHEPRGKFADWPQKFPGSVVGACWDQQSQTLFLLHKYQWTHGPEKLPTIAAYKVN